MASIYSLQTEGLIWYIGSTTDAYKRQYNHHSISNKTSSRFIPKEYEYKLIVLEICPLETRHEREQYFIDTLHPLYNEKRTIKDPLYLQNYRKENKEKISDYNKQYVKNNTDKVCETQKKWYERNKEKLKEQHSCECGGNYTVQNKSIHTKTKIHQKFLSNQ